VVVVVVVVVVMVVVVLVVVVVIVVLVVVRRRIGSVNRAVNHGRCGQCTIPRRDDLKRAIVDRRSNMRARHVDYAQFKHEKSRTIQRITVQSQEAFDPQRRTR